MKLFKLVTPYGIAVVIAKNREKAWETLKKQEGEEEPLTFNKDADGLTRVLPQEGVIAYYST